MAAVDALERAVNLAPEEPVFNYHLGMAYQAKGDIESARRYLKAAFEPGRSFEGMDEARKALDAISKG